MTDASMPTPQESPAEVTPVAPSTPSAARPPFPWERQPGPAPAPEQPTGEQAAPESTEAATPSPTPAPAPPAEDIERLRAQAAQFEELQQAVKREQERLAREAEQTRRQEEFRSRAREIWDIAQRFDTDEERRGYYERHIAALTAETEQHYRQQVEAEREAVRQEQMANLIAGYPDWLKTQFGLDDDDVEELRVLTDPEQMTVAARSMQRMKKRYGELKTIAEQAYANTQAAQLRQTVTSGNISGAPGARELPSSVRSGDRTSRELLAQALGLPRT